MIDSAALRTRFPHLDERLYLNAASEGAMPEDAVREAERLVRLKARPWEIGIDYYYKTPAVVRARIETLTSAPAGSVALLGGTSAGIGIAAQRLPISAGDEVLLLQGQFPSNVYPWRAAEHRGAVVRAVPRAPGTDPTRAILGALGPATRVVAVDWVNFMDGAVVDLEAVGSECRSRGIRFIVDGAQGAGALRIDLGRAPVDLFAAPSHKWLLGPVGTGFAFVAPELLDVLQPWNSGWVNIAAGSGFRNMLRLTGEPPGDATRFETGSPAYSIYGAWQRSLELLIELGPEQVERRVSALAERVADGIADMASRAPASGVSLVSARAPARRSGIVSFQAGERTLAVYRALEEANVTTAFREGAIRVAAHVYNTDSEINSFLEIVRRAAA